MLGLTPSEMQLLWERRVDVLEIREPRWILRTVFAPLVLLIIYVVSIGFSTSATRQAAIAYTPFFLFSIVLYFWVKRLNVDRNSPRFVHRKAASIYGSFDASALVLISATTLVGGLSLLVLAELEQRFTMLLATVTIFLYLGGALVVLAYSPKLIQRRAQSEKPDWSPAPNWVNAATSLLIGFSMVAGIVLARTAETGIDMLIGSALLLIGAFVILPIYIRGLLEVIVLLLSGFNFGAAPDIHERSDNSRPNSADR